MKLERRLKYLGRFECFFIKITWCAIVSLEDSHNTGVNLKDTVKPKFSTLKVIDLNCKS